MCGIAGYFGYQHFMESSERTSSTAEPISYEFWLSLPEKCHTDGKNLENAFHRHMAGEIIKVDVLGYTNNFRRCLKDAGFTKSQIDEAYNKMRDSADYNRW